MKLLNTNRFPLPGTNDRFIHVATVQEGLHEYICFFDSLEQKLYLEEITHSQLEFIEDDELAESLQNFLFEKNVINLKYGAFVADK